jgi:competence protein ComEC
MKKIITSIFILLLISFASNKSSFSSEYFKIIFLDVGQGDAVLIITPQNKTILIDGGPDNSLLKELGKYLPFWKRELDLVVLTHAHDDHFMGLIEISRRYQVKKFVYNNLNFFNPSLDALKKYLNNNKSLIKEVASDDYFLFDNNCRLNIMFASKDNLRDENDYSIVSAWSCLGRRVLLTGDASSIIENNLIVSDIDLKADILKVSHHGSITATDDNFLELVNPTQAVISVGKNNKFHHPSDLILTKLKKKAVDIYRTDSLGSITFLANNKELKVINSGWISSVD